MRRESSQTCSITGDKIDTTEANEWNCELESYPIDGEHGEYEYAQAYFEIENVIQANINQNQLPKTTEAIEDENIEITIVIDNSDVKPKPEFKWFLDEKPLDVDKSKIGRNGLSHTIEFKAKLSDSGRRITCLIIQIGKGNSNVFSKQKIAPLLIY